MEDKGTYYSWEQFYSKNNLLELQNYFVLQKSSVRHC